MIQLPYLDLQVETHSGHVPATATVLPEDTILLYSNLECMGNKALSLLIGSCIDGYFQRVIKQFEEHGDRALEFIKKQCADIGAMDRHYFHQVFNSIHIKDNKSVTNYLQCFTYGKSSRGKFQ